MATLSVEVGWFIVSWGMVWLNFLAFVHLGKGTESISDAGAGTGYILLLKQQNDHENEDQPCGTQTHIFIFTFAVFCFW